MSAASVYQTAADTLRQRDTLKRQYGIGLILGSGLNALAEQLADPVSVPYAELAGFPQSTVAGHAGQFLLGTLAGHSVVCMQGRLHYYEGHQAADLAIPVRTLYALGCHTLVITNAAGSLRPDTLTPGDLMLLTDHINWAGVNPLRGPNNDALGPRFFDMSRAYDVELAELARRAAAQTDIGLTDGVYVMYPGPNFETPAEIRALQTLGGDAVGMSTVPECLVARHCGMRVVAFSTITNLAAGLSTTPLSHEETLSVGSAAADKLGRLIVALLTSMTA